MTARPWAQQQLQGQRGLRIAEPTSTPRQGMHAPTSRFNGDWNKEDTLPGIGPSHCQSQQYLSNQEVNPMFSNLYRYTPVETETTDKLFVFGIARRGFHLNVVAERDGYIGPALTMPEYKMISIADVFPAILRGGDVSIVGELFYTKPRTLDFLDSIHDCPNFHKREIVSLNDGTRAYVYLINKWKMSNREEEISSGDWIEWKKNTRAREKEKKERFKAQMAKGKEEAARRRALAQALDAEPSSHRTSGVVVTSGGLYNKQWNPVTNSYNYRATEPRVEKGSKMIHITDVPLVDLKIKLRDNGINPDGIDESCIRIECMTRYGSWYKVDK